MGYFAAACLLAVQPVLAAAKVDGPLATVRVEEGESIRDLAARYLKDPDLWPQIIELSGLGSVIDVRPGIELKVPIQQVAAADEALGVSLVSIQRATSEGARIFAPVEIGTAIEKREEAVEFRSDGAWSDVVVHANQATTYAGKALEISLEQRDRAAEAVLSDAHGDVEGRSPVEPGWSERDLNDVLIEFEQVRTLSGSTAQVTFRDLSRLRLNPNSNAVIQKMRSDPLTGTQVTRVSLVEGDFYALLNQLHDHADFEVDVPGVETEATSADFWISHNDKASRFANFDDAQMRIRAHNQTVELGKNEGALVPAKDGAVVEVQVLQRPELLLPAEDTVVFNGRVSLEWSGPETAAGYWLEIAADADFNAMKVSQWGLTETTTEVEALEPGDYFWRISALDDLGLPGERSLAHTFTAALDTTPPFLAIGSPKEDELVRTASLAVTGESEIGAIVTVDGAAVVLDDDGGFETALELEPGQHEVTLEAVDQAGNRTTRTRRFTYRPDRRAEISFDPAIPSDGSRRLLTRGDELGVVGRSDAEVGSRLIVRDVAGEVVADALIEEGGGFRFAVPASESGVTYTVRIVAISGETEGEISFVAIRDRLPPTLTFEVPPPVATSVRWLQLWGRADGAATLRVNGVDLKVIDGGFETLVSLEPGPNPIDLIATDRVGNVAVQELEVLLDLDPPEVGAAEVWRAGGADDPIEIKVVAADAAGLKQAAPFTISIGDQERSGYLRYEAEAGAYRQTLPPAAGRLRLVEVTVEDYAGNMTVRRFD